MRAIGINGFGGPDVFQELAMPKPDPVAGEVVIDVRASSVNPVDYKIRDGRAARLCPNLPAVLHADCAGVVHAVGAGVSRFREGDEVYAFANGIGGRPGALAEFMAADARMVAAKPPSLTFEEAAALPLVTVTVWFCYFDRHDLQPGETVLVQGGTGGVGHVAVQLAAWRGAQVHATCGSAEKCRIAESLGAIRAFDYGAASAADMRAATEGGQGFDTVFNTPGAPSVDSSVELARDFGTILDILGHFPTRPGFQGKWLAFKSVFAGRPMVSGDRVEAVGEILEKAAELVAEGSLRPLVDARRFGFTEVGAAHEYAEHGRPTGKVVLTNDLRES